MQYKKYGAIILDPPWKYSNSGVNGAAQKHYNTMSTPDLCKIPVASWAADDSVLFLWGTWPLLPDVMTLGAAWGFDYVTALPWIKLQPNTPIPELRPSWGTGFWVRGCSEVITIWRRGKPALPKVTHLGLVSERFKHSKKPDSIHVIAEELNGPYLEMFAREERAGWDVVGDEVNGTVLGDVSSGSQMSIFDMASP